MNPCKPLFKYGIFDRLINFHILGSQVIYIFGISIGYIVYGIAFNFGLYFGIRRSGYDAYADCTLWYYWSINEIKSGMTEMLSVPAEFCDLFRRMYQ